MGTYDKPVHAICVDKTSCRHELSAEGEPAKQPEARMQSGGQSSGHEAENYILKGYRQGLEKPRTGSQGT